MKKISIIVSTILTMFIFFVLGHSLVNASKPSDFGLKEGDLISAIFSDDPDVYIVNEHGYKRLFLNPEIFKFYTHLGGFANVKLVTQEVRDAFPTTGLFRNCENNDLKVYGFESDNEDKGKLRWIDTPGDQAIKDDPNFFKKVFCINNKEFNWYPRGEEFKSVKEVPQYRRETMPATPAIPAIPASPSQPLISPTITPKPASGSFTPTPTPAVQPAIPAIPATPAQPATTTSPTPTLTVSPTPTSIASPSFSPTPTPTTTLGPTPTPTPTSQVTFSNVNIATTQNSATVSLTTNLSVYSSIYPSDGQGWGTLYPQSASPGTNHSWLITGLGSGTTYAYKFYVFNTNTSAYYNGSFTTLASTPTPTPMPTISNIDFAVTDVSASPSSVVTGSPVVVSATFYNPSNTTQSIQVTIGKGAASVNDGTLMSTTYYLSLPPGSTTRTHTFTGSYGAISSLYGSPANTYYPEASISGVGNGPIYINPYDPNTANNYLRATTAYIVTSAPTPTPTPTPLSDVTPPVISPVRVDVAYSSAMASWTALVVWLTNENSTSQVEYGLTSSYGTITPLDSSGAFLRTVHSIILSPEYGYTLKSGTTYHYRMISRDASHNTATTIDYTFTTPQSTSQSNFSRDLALGSTGNDVKQLQALLVNEVNYPANLLTGYFGSITQNAVKRLQEKYGVRPAYGYFGEITRKTLKALISSY